MSCEVCDQPVYAETENWASPLCHSHFVKHNTSTKTYLIIKLEAVTAERDIYVKQVNKDAEIEIERNHLRAKLEASEKRLNYQMRQCLKIEDELEETKGLLDTATNVIQFLKDEFPSVKIIMDAAAKKIKANE